MKALVLVATAMAAFGSTAAGAQVSAGNFDGPRIEARVGWDQLTLDATVTDGTDSFSRDASKDGVTYGGEVGYDYRVNNFVLGAYAGLEGSSVKECGELYGLDELCVKSGRNITAGVRLGAVISDNFMIYGKGGYSNGRAKITYEDYELILADVNEGRNFGGFHLGAGVEGEIAGRVYGRLEYVYSNYSEPSVTIDGVRASLEPSRHQIVYGMGVRF